MSLIEEGLFNPETNFLVFGRRIGEDIVEMGHFNDGKLDEIDLRIDFDGSIKCGNSINWFEYIDLNHHFKVLQEASIYESTTTFQDLIKLNLTMDEIYQNYSQYKGRNLLILIGIQDSSDSLEQVRHLMEYKM